MRRCIVALLVLGSAACASAPRAAAPTLAYAVPPVNPASYEIADTAYVLVQGGRGRSLGITIALAARAAVGMHVDSLGLLASIRLETVDGTFVADDQVTAQVDASSVPSGSALLRMSAEGPQATIHVPGLSGPLARFIGGESFFHGFFIQLPAARVSPGTVWTDTLVHVDDAIGVHSRTETVVSSMVIGDTLVDGRSLRVIASRLSTRTELDGIVDGMEVSQRIIGSGEASMFWDDAASLLVWREESITSTGTMDLPAAGMRGVPVEVRTRTVLRLRP